MTRGGDKNEAEEIFQESIARFFHQAMKEDFDTSKGCEPYIFGIAKNVFFSAKKNQVNMIPIDEAFEFSEEAATNREEVATIVDQLMQFTTETCRQVLHFWATGLSMALIANHMNYKSEMMARKKKHDCLKKLSEYLKMHPQIIKKILDDE